MIPDGRPDLWDRAGVTVSGWTEADHEQERRTSSEGPGSGYREIREDNWCHGIVLCACVGVDVGGAGWLFAFGIKSGNIAARHGIPHLAQCPFKKPLVPLPIGS